MIDLPWHSTCKSFISFREIIRSLSIGFFRYDSSDDGFIDSKELAKMITAMVR